MKLLSINLIILLMLSLLPATLPQLQGQTLLEKTPADEEGPFYPLTSRPDMDNDLLQVADRPRNAEGNILHLAGKVVNTRSEPLPDVTVEIWQADPQGRYLHPRDPNAGRHDPDFQYWGRDVTGKDGSYSFTTLIPGGYGSRPPHIHFKVWQDGADRLTSQIYFLNHPGSGEKIGRHKIDKLQTVDLEQAEPGVYLASFRIVID